MMRHTSLETTTKYLRTVPERMEDAVKNLGATFGGGFDSNRAQKATQIDKAPENIRVSSDGLITRNSLGKVDGVGSFQETTDTPIGHKDLCVLARHHKIANTPATDPKRLEGLNRYSISPSSPATRVTTCHTPSSDISNRAWKAHTKTSPDCSR